MSAGVTQLLLEWNQGSEQARVSWRTRPAGRTAEWFRTIDRLGHGGKRNPPLPGMAAALTRYGDVFQLAIGPRPLRSAVRALCVCSRWPLAAPSPGALAPLKRPARARA